MAALTIARPDLRNGGLEHIALGFEELAISPKSKRNKEERVSIDLSGILDASRKKLPSLDTQRIVAVLDEAILKSEVVSLLPFVVDNIDRFSVTLGCNLVKILKEYDHLQKEYTKALAIQRKCRPSSATALHESDSDNTAANQDAKFRESCESVAALSLRLFAIVKCSLRLFRSNPAAVTTIRNEKNERTYEANNFIDNLGLLQNQIYSRLAASLGEEREKQRNIVQVLNCEKKTQAQIQRLEEELRIATQEQSDEINEKNEILRKLKLSIQTVEHEADNVNRKLISDATKSQTSEVKSSESRQSKLQQDLIKAKQQLQASLNVHKESELGLRKRRYKIETEVENWIRKYDTDLTDKQSDIDELTAYYNDEKKQLSTLEQKFVKLEKDYLVIMEERRVAREKREQAERELRAMIKAATLLQSFWRAYKCRKALKLKQKKEKRSGKKKQKKK